MLWRSDGTEAGTFPIRTLQSIASSFYQIDVNGTLFFVDGDQIWKTNGTSAGTTLVKDVSPRWMLNANGALFFATNDYQIGVWPLEE